MTLVRLRLSLTRDAVGVLFGPERFPCRVKRECPMCGTRTVTIFPGVK